MFVKGFGIRGRDTGLGGKMDVLFNTEKAIKKPQKKIRNKEVLALLKWNGYFEITLS